MEERLSASETSRVAGHIDRCQACQSKLESLASADGPIWDRPRPTVVINPLLQRLAGQPQAAETPVPSPETGPAAALLDLNAVAGYKLLEVLGHGGTAVVYKALHSKLDRFVALKLTLSGTHSSQDEVVRFRAEAETVARLHHPNIVQIYDIGEVDGRLFLSLEYVEGGNLCRLTPDGSVTPNQAACLVETLARTMHHCHQQGIIHRDLKPANILLEQVRDEPRETAGLFSTTAPRPGQSRSSGPTSPTSASRNAWMSRSASPAPG